MPIAWIPGRYGNSVAPTQISILSSLWSPWSPAVMGAGVLSEATFLERWIEERQESDESLRLTDVCVGGRSTSSTLWLLFLHYLNKPLIEGMKVVEIEKCRNDIKKLREEMASRNNR
ncbi:hypothetical protein PAMP_004217 [Pampus punctatissimus]